MEDNSEEIYISQAEYYIQECFDLARKALGKTSPNPIVGAIVLDKEGHPVGRGFHSKAGEDHAEVKALKEAGIKSRGGTLFINLEPCCHYGNTPPCTDLIIKSGISQVYFSSYDPNPLVNFSGEQILKNNNIKVFSRILEHEGNELNKFFFKWIKTKLPWIALKQAQTLNGRLSLAKNETTVISSEDSRIEVHKLRNSYDAVMVGANTVKVDDPELTVRLIEGGRNPKRIILDSNLETFPGSKVYKTNKYDEVYIFTKEGNESNIQNFKTINPLVNIIEVNQNKLNRLDLKSVFIELGKLNILSLLIEAGPILANELITENLLDEYILFISPKFFSNIYEGSTSPLGTHSNKNIYNFKIYDHKLIGNDLMVSLYPNLY